MDNDYKVRFCPLRADMNQGSKLSGGTTGCAPNINESPTFQAYVKAATAWMITSGTGTPGSVGDGKTFGAGFVLGNAALEETPVELWSKQDQKDKFPLATVALFKSNAERLNLRHEEPSPEMRARSWG